MTKHDTSQDDDALAILYQKRKAGHLSPDSVKQDIHNALATNKSTSTPWWRINLLPFAQMSAVTCTIAVTFIVISVQVMNKESAPLIAAIEIHQLGPANKPLIDAGPALKNSLSSPAKTKERLIQYQRAQNVYFARQADLAAHQQSYATVLQSKDGLSLLTCDKHLLKLSQEVVDMLLSVKRDKGLDFSKGQMLALVFDSKGHIIDISQKETNTEC
jgi:hypothetical protein